VVIIEKVGVTPLEEKMRETRLRWFEHVKRRSVNASVRRREEINLMHCRRERDIGQRSLGTRSLAVI